MLYPLHLSDEPAVQRLVANIRFFTGWNLAGEISMSWYWLFIFSHYLCPDIFHGSSRNIRSEWTGLV